MTVAVVTDSTSCLAPDVAASAGVRVVPLQLVLGGVPHDDGVDADQHSVVAAQRSRTQVSTSRPSPQVLLDAYRDAAAAGADAVLSLHISAAMSGTYESAVLAARESPVPVRVVDSRSMGMGLGFLALTSAQEAAAGGALAQLEAAALQRAARTRAWFTVTTLEHLRRGGRIGAASALLGTALAIKPLLHLDDGIIAPLERVRTTGRALARLAELAGQVAAAAGGADAVDVAVQHLDTPARAEQLVGLLADRLPGARVRTVEVSGAVAVHVGPGMVALVVAPVR
ncbi:DegV family protein [Angustibacter aerolatus]